MNENLTNVAWKCKRCGEITYHPSAKKDSKLEIRTTTLCLKCISPAVSCYSAMEEEA